MYESVFPAVDESRPCPTARLRHVPLGSAGVVESADMRACEAHVAELCAPVLDRQAAASGLADLPVVMVAGGKGVGKSTLSKLLVNTLLAQHPAVAYLECDTGQPEYTPCGLVSLHILTAPVTGPAFTHLQPAVASVFTGTDSSGNDPAAYLRALFGLYDLFLFGADKRVDGGAAAALASSMVCCCPCRNRCLAQGKIPLIINTQGWVRGTGMSWHHRKRRNLHRWLAHFFFLSSFLHQVLHCCAT